jgi:hypothetical protein
VNIISDDEMYRVDSVWLGPPNATLPWRARYVAWGIGLVATLLVLTLVRTMFAFGFFTVAWSIVIAVALTRAIGKKITHERPLRDVGWMAIREVTTPRRNTDVQGGTANTSAVTVRADRPRPATTRTRRRSA